MLRPVRVALCALCVPLLAAPAAAAPPAPPGALPLERVFADPPLGGRPPMQLDLSPDGALLAYLRPSDADSEILELWGRRLPPTGAPGAPERLVAAADLLGAAAQRLTEAEKMALERRRISERGITSFLWCGERGDALLFPLSGDLYWARLGPPGAAPAVTRLTHDEAPELAPRCSPAGDRVAFTRDGDVHVLDLGPRPTRPRRLTRGASATRTFGLAEFIAEEEMGRHSGLWWSPDGQRLLLFEVDESPVGEKLRPQIFADRTTLFSQRYPAAGEPNARVTAHVYDLRTGRRTTLATPPEDGYLARAGFFPDGAPWLVWQPRDQRRLVLFEADARGALRPILEDADPAWVELHDDLAPLPDGALLWSSERSGRRQLERVDRQSGARTALTAETDPVDALAAVDEDAGLIYFTSAASRGRERHLRAVPMGGGPSRPVAVSPGWHSVTFADRGPRYVDVVSRWGVPPRTLLADARGGEPTVLDANPTPELDALSAPEPLWRDLPASDGAPLNAVLLPPVQRPPGARFPVIAWIYGGPTHQMVANRWQRSHPLFVHLTQRGYGVLLVDNRGTGGADRDTNRAHHRAFGQAEVDDLFAAVRASATAFEGVDPARIGVWGWSYGGFLAARAVLDAETPFAAAWAAAPVTDWTLYDTHYTERYLGLPDGGRAEAYARSNLVARAPLLARPLMLVHGTADDNVLFEHTLRLIEALQAQSLPFELMIYPGKAHGIAGRAAQLHLFRTCFAFFDRALRPAQ